MLTQRPSQIHTRQLYMHKPAITSVQAITINRMRSRRRRAFCVCIRAKDHEWESDVASYAGLHLALCMRMMSKKVRAAVCCNRKCREDHLNGTMIVSLGQLKIYIPHDPATGQSPNNRTDVCQISPSS